MSNNDTNELPATANAAGKPKATASPEFKVGQKVSHPDGNTYTVAGIEKEGIRLEGIALLITPSVLKAV